MSAVGIPLLQQGEDVKTSKSALEDLVYTMIILHGSDCSLNHIDVSRITDFSGLCMIVNIIDTGS